jgi:hypothetical protein
MAAAGYRPQSAVPWPKEDYLRVQRHLQEQVHSQTGVSRLLAARDGVAMALTWQLYSRGVTAISWQLSQFSSASGKPWSLELHAVA